MAYQSLRGSHRQSQCCLRVAATATELVSFTHGALFSPAALTNNTCDCFKKRISSEFSGLFITHPSQLPTLHSAATIKGHLDQSTKAHLITPDSKHISEPNSEEFPNSPINGERSHFCYVHRRTHWSNLHIPNRKICYTIKPRQQSFNHPLRLR